MLKMILKNIGYTLLSIIIVIFILNIFYYFNLLSDKIMNLFMIITSLLCFFISGRLFTKKDKSKKIISGLKIGIIYDILFLIITLIFLRNTFSPFNIIYYLLILLSTIFGSITNNKENYKT